MIRLTYTLTATEQNKNKCKSRWNLRRIMISHTHTTTRSRTNHHLVFFYLHFGQFSVPIHHCLWLCFGFRILSHCLFFTNTLYTLINLATNLNNYIFFGFFFCVPIKVWKRTNKTKTAVRCVTGIFSYASLIWKQYHLSFDLALIQIMIPVSCQ